MWPQHNKWGLFSSGEFSTINVHEAKKNNIYKMASLTRLIINGKYNGLILNRTVNKNTSQLL